MIDIEALFKVSYGLYIVSSGDKNNGNAYISNTVFQVTAEPPTFATCCNKDNFTAQLIEEQGHFAVSVLTEQASFETFGLGYKSGKDVNKLDGFTIEYGVTGSPIVLNDTLATMEFKVINKFDVGTHWLFIGELISAKITNPEASPITYDYYRNIKKGLAPKNAPTYVDKSKLGKTQPPTSKQYKCIVCGYIYDESKEPSPFKDLPEDYKCPICGADKEDFLEVQ